MLSQSEIEPWHTLQLHDYFWANLKKKKSEGTSSFQ